MGSKIPDQYRKYQPEYLVINDQDPVESRYKGIRYKFFLNSKNHFELRYRQPNAIQETCKAYDLGVDNILPEKFERIAKNLVKMSVLAEQKQINKLKATRFQIMDVEDEEAQTEYQRLAACMRASEEETQPEPKEEVNEQYKAEKSILEELFDEKKQADELGLKAVSDKELSEHRKEINEFDELIEKRKDLASKALASSVSDADVQRVLNGSEDLELTKDELEGLASAELAQADILQEMEAIATNAGRKTGLITAYPGFGKTYLAKVFKKRVEEGKTSLPPGTRVLMYTASGLEGLKEEKESPNVAIARILSVLEGANPPIVLIGDEFHHWGQKSNWVGGRPLVEEMKTKTDQGRLRVIGMTTPKEARDPEIAGVLQTDSAIKRRFSERFYSDISPEKVAGQLYSAGKAEICAKNPDIDLKPGHVFMAALLARDCFLPKADEQPRALLAKTKTFLEDLVGKSNGQDIKRTDFEWVLKKHDIQKSKTDLNRLEALAEFFNLHYATRWITLRLFEQDQLNQVNVAEIQKKIKEQHEKIQGDPRTEEEALAKLYYDFQGKVNEKLKKYCFDDAIHEVSQKIEKQKELLKRTKRAEEEKYRKFSKQVGAWQALLAGNIEEQAVLDGSELRKIYEEKKQALKDLKEITDKKIKEYENRIKEKEASLAGRNFKTYIIAQKVCFKIAKEKLDEIIKQKELELRDFSKAVRGKEDNAKLLSLVKQRRTAFRNYVTLRKLSEAEFTNFEKKSGRQQARLLAIKQEIRKALEEGGLADRILPNPYELLSLQERYQFPDWLSKYHSRLGKKDTKDEKDPKEMLKALYEEIKKQSSSTFTKKEQEEIEKAYFLHDFDYEPGDLLNNFFYSQEHLELKPKEKLPDAAGAAGLSGGMSGGTSAGISAGVAGGGLSGQAALQEGAAQDVTQRRVVQSQEALQLESKATENIAKLTDFLSAKEKIEEERKEEERKRLEANQAQQTQMMLNFQQLATTLTANGLDQGHHMKVLEKSQEALKKTQAEAQEKALAAQKVAEKQAAKERKALEEQATKAQKAAQEQLEKLQKELAVAKTAQEVALKLAEQKHQEQLEAMQQKMQTELNKNYHRFIKQNSAFKKQVKNDVDKKAELFGAAVSQHAGVVKKQLASLERKQREHGRTLQGAIGTAQAEIKNLQDQIESAKDGEKEALEQKLRGLKQSLKQSLEGTLSEKQAAAETELETKLNQGLSALDGRVSNIETWKSQFSTAVEEKLANLTKAQGDAEEEAAAQQKLIIALQGQNAEFQTKLEGQKSPEELEAMKKELEKSMGIFLDSKLQGYAKTAALDALKANMQETKEQIDKELAEAKTERDTLSQAVDRHEKRFTRHEKRLQSQEREMKALTAQVRLAQAGNAEAIKAMQAEIDENNLVIAQVKTAQAGNGTAIQDLQGMLATINTQLDQFATKDALGVVSGQVSALKGALSVQKEELLTAINNAKDALRIELFAEISGNLNKFEKQSALVRAAGDAAKKEQLAEMKGVAESVMKANRELFEKNAKTLGADLKQAVEAKLAATERAIKRDYNALHGQVSGFGKRLGAQEADVAATKADVIASKADVEALKTRFNRLDGRLKTAEGTLIDHETQLATHSETLAEHSEKMGSLERSLKREIGRIDTNEKNIGKLQEKIKKYDKLIQDKVDAAKDAEERVRILEEEKAKAKDKEKQSIAEKEKFKTQGEKEKQELAEEYRKELKKHRKEIEKTLKEQKEALEKDFKEYYEAQRTEIRGVESRASAAVASAKNKAADGLAALKEEHQTTLLEHKTELADLQARLEEQEGRIFEAPVHQQFHIKTSNMQHSYISNKSEAKQFKDLVGALNQELNGKGRAADKTKDLMQYLSLINEMDSYTPKHSEEGKLFRIAYLGTKQGLQGKTMGDVDIKVFVQTVKNEINDALSVANTINVKALKDSGARANDKHKIMGDVRLVYKRLLPFYMAWRKGLLNHERFKNEREKLEKHFEDLQALLATYLSNADLSNEGSFKGPLEAMQKFGKGEGKIEFDMNKYDGCGDKQRCLGTFVNPGQSQKCTNNRYTLGNRFILRWKPITSTDN